MKILLDNEADVNLQCPSRVDRKRALHFGAASGNVEVSELCKMMTAVSYFRQKCVVGSYLSNHISTESTVFYFINDRLLPQVCRLLLEAGATTKKPLDFESTPLEFAINNGKKGACRTLLRYNENILLAYYE